MKKGFTLIELSIVLVIIGLIVGGVLVGRDLIGAAETRATISQLEKYKTAANTFRLKYNYLPGDIAAATVAQLGFTGVPTRAGTTSRGDGNGAVQGQCYTCPQPMNGLSAGETAWFWVDLTTNSQLIDGAFNTATDNAFGGTISPTLVMPAAKLGGNNYIYVYHFGVGGGGYGTVGQNYFGLSYIGGVGTNGEPYGPADGKSGLTPLQAQQIDSKLDDGLPQTGTVTAKSVDWTKACAYTGCQASWAAGNTNIGALAGVSTGASATSCYDNNSTTNAMQYSTGYSPAATNCGLSFRF